MTEEEWLTSGNAQPILAFLRGRVTERKLRLFGCGCVRRLAYLLGEASRAVLEVAERYADGEASQQDRELAYDSALERFCEVDALHASPVDRERDPLFSAERAVACVVGDFLSGYTPDGNIEVGHAQGVAELAIQASFLAGLHDTKQLDLPIDLSDAACSVERTFQASLLRHLVGNPFHPYPSPRCCPSPVVQLADALYHGQHCGFALHDALLDAGRPELARHFQGEAEHPKGCWALDLLLGKG